MSASNHSRRSFVFEGSSARFCCDEAERVKVYLRMIVIATCAKRAVAIQLDFFVVPRAELLAMTEFEDTP